MKRAPKRSTKPAPLSRSTSRRLADERDQLAAQVEELHERMNKRVDAALDARDIAIARLYAIDELLREGASKVARGEAEWTSELERVRELIAAYADAKQGYDAFRQIAAKAQELADELIVTREKLATANQELLEAHGDEDELDRVADDLRNTLTARDAELAEARRERDEWKEAREVEAALTVAVSARCAKLETWARQLLATDGASGEHRSRTDAITARDELRALLDAPAKDTP